MQCAPKAVTQPGNDANVRDGQEKERKVIRGSPGSQGIDMVTTGCFGLVKFVVTDNPLAVQPLGHRAGLKLNEGEDVQARLFG